MRATPAAGVMLNQSEAEELRRLLSKAKYQGLTPHEELRLRWLVGKQSPGSQNASLADLIAIGLMLLGLLALLGILTKR